jgi:ketosteroid isomerase-like protein
MDAEEREALVRRSIDGWNAADWEDKLRAIWRDDGEIVSPEGWPESGTFRGMEEMLQQWRRVKGSWADERVELIETESIGDQVLGHVRWSMKGESSGAPLNVDAWILTDFKDGRLSRMQYMFDEESARAAVEGAA